MLSCTKWYFSTWRLHIVIFVKVLRCKNEQINKILNIYINNLNLGVEILFSNAKQYVGWSEKQNICCIQNFNLKK